MEGDAVTDDHDLRYADRPARLRWLESRDQVISAQLHELTRQRTRNREEALRLRVSMTAPEIEEYELMRLEDAVR